MRMRVWILVGAILVVVPQGGVRPGWGEEQPQTGAASKPPVITYRGSRSSSTWVGKEGAARVAVGKGIQWRGVKVYLSLTWDLVGVDATTGKTLYVQHVGAFWNTLTFKAVAPRGEAQRWAVELQPGPRQRRGVERRQYHDLRTGAKLDVPGLVKPPAGEVFRPRLNWYGDKSHIAERFTLIASTEANWKTLRERMFDQADLARFEAVDFEREVVLVVSTGNGWNCNGLDFGAAYEDAQRILLRTDRRSFQTIGGGQKVRAWGVFVLPRRADKAYEVERNKQNLIGGPAIWARIFRVERLGPAEKELAKLPAKAASPHYGREEQSELPPPRQPPPVRPPR